MPDRLAPDPDRGNGPRDPRRAGRGAPARLGSLGVRDTPPTFRSPGPTVVQLERLQQLVSARVHVADVLVGESRLARGLLDHHRRRPAGRWICPSPRSRTGTRRRGPPRSSCPGRPCCRRASITRRPGSGTSNPGAGSLWPARSWATAGPSRSRRCGRAQRLVERAAGAGGQRGDGPPGRGGHARGFLPRRPGWRVSRPLEVTCPGIPSPSRPSLSPNLDERAAIPRGTAAPLHSSGGKMSTRDRPHRDAFGTPAVPPPTDTTPGPAASHDHGRGPCLVHLVRRAEDADPRAEGLVRRRGVRGRGAIPLPPPARS